MKRKKEGKERMMIWKPVDHTHRECVFQRNNITLIFMTGSLSLFIEMFVCIRKGRPTVFLLSVRTPVLVLQLPDPINCSVMHCRCQHDTLGKSFNYSFSPRLSLSGFLSHSLVFSLTLWFSLSSVFSLLPFFFLILLSRPKKEPQRQI